MQYSQEHLKTMLYAKFGGQTECIMGNSKIVNWKCHPIIVTPVVKMWPHPVAHPYKPLVREYPPPPGEKHTTFMLDLTQPDIIYKYLAV